MPSIAYPYTTYCLVLQRINQIEEKGCSAFYRSLVFYASKGFAATFWNFCKPGLYLRLRNVPYLFAGPFQGQRNTAAYQSHR